MAGILKIPANLFKLAGGYIQALGSKIALGGNAKGYIEDNTSAGREVLSIKSRSDNKGGAINLFGDSDGVAPGIVTLYGYDAGLQEGIRVNADGTLDFKSVHQALDQDFVNNALGYPLTVNTSFDLTTIPSGFWQSIGPTGSGATNIWTALDSIKLGRPWIEVRLVSTLQRNSATAASFSQTLNAVKHGGTQTFSGSTAIQQLYGVNYPNVNTTIADTVSHKIPIDSAGRFDIHRVIFNVTGGSSFLYLVG